MIEFFKNIIPMIPFVIGYTFELISKAALSITKLFYNVSIKLHMLFNTKLGKAFNKAKKELEETIENLKNSIQRGVGNTREEDRLAQIIKGPKATSSNKNKNGNN